jgi:hypothetical protein
MSRSFVPGQPAWRRIALAVVSGLLLASCGGGAKAPSTSPEIISITPGDGQVVVVFKQDPTLQYWIFGAPDPSISIRNWFNLPHAVSVHPSYSPQIVSGLLTTVGPYSFIMNSTLNGSPAGPTTAPVTPRLAGSSWLEFSGTGGLPTAATTSLTAATRFADNFVVTGTNGSVLTSTDLPYAAALGQNPTWTARATGLTGTLRTAITTPSTVVVAGDNGSIAWTGDLSTWSPPVNPTFYLTGGGTTPLASVSFQSLAYSTGGLYVALTRVQAGGGTSAMIFTSGDLVTWTQQGAAIIPAGGNYNRLTQIWGIFCLLGSNGAMFVSGDAINWTPITTPAGGQNDDMRGAAAGIGSTGNGQVQFIAVGDGGASGGVIWSSPDAINWSRQVASPSALSGITFGSRFVAVGDAGAAVFSDDAVHWTVPNTPPAATDNLNTVFYAMGSYLGLGSKTTNGQGALSVAY